MKITIPYLCEYSSMLTSYIIDAERNPNSSLHAIISLVTIPWLHFVTIT